jgi:hypothetical protein
MDQNARLLRRFHLRLRELLMFDFVKRKIAEWRKAPATVAERTAARAQPMIRESSRTKVGNVPWFKGPLKGSSDIPTTVTASGDELKINMVDWALEKEYKKGLSDKLATIAREEAIAVVRGR